MPVIWLIDAYRAGERGQVRALADALGGRLEIKQLRYRYWQFLPHLLQLDSLAGLQRESIAQLQAPWPDLVISCGVRNEPVCRWIRAQSGGHTRYVHVGRPWAALQRFDLLVTTPQYRVPEADNVVHNTLTLHSLTTARLAASAQLWEASFAQLPRPHIALFVGGNSGPFTLGKKAAHRLAKQAAALVRANGGSLLVTTSSRTPAAATAALRSKLDVPNYFYEWCAGEQANPYLGMLAAADQIIVTADSIAMLSEACASGKPVHMFDLGGMHEALGVELDFRLGGYLYGVLLRWLWRPLSRDITLVHQRLLKAGRVVWLGEPATSVLLALPAADLERAVLAVRALLAEGGAGGAVE